MAECLTKRQLVCRINEVDKCLDKLEEKYFRLKKEKLDIEQLLKETICQQHAAKKKAICLAKKNKQLERELADINEMALLVKAECNNAIRNSVEKINRLQARAHEIALQSEYLKLEAADLRCEKEQLLIKLKCFQDTKSQLQSALETALDEKCQMCKRIQELETCEQNYKMEIDRLVRLSVNQRRALCENDSSPNNSQNVPITLEPKEQGEPIKKSTQPKEPLKKPVQLKDLVGKPIQPREFNGKPIQPKELIGQPTQPNKHTEEQKCSGTSSEPPPPEPIRVLLTGATGRISNNLLPMIAKGDVFGPEQTLMIHLFDIPDKKQQLQSLVMEFLDCAYPLVQCVFCTDELEDACKDVTAAFLVGAKSQSPGMDVRDLLPENAPIFKAQGEALDKNAKKDVKVLVVGDPVNTNALICSKFAPSIPKENFSSLNRLDQNRASVQIACKANVPVSQINNVIIWGNHSSTQVPDVTQAKINSLPVEDVIKDQTWITNEFVPTIQQRTNILLEAKGESAAMSTAKAAADQMNNWFKGTESGKFVSMGVMSDGSYCVPKDLIFSFPVEIKDGKWFIVQGLTVKDEIKKMMDASRRELEEDRDAAFKILGN